MSHLHIPDGILPSILWIAGLVITALLLLWSAFATRGLGARGIAFQSALGGIMLAVMALPVPITAFDLYGWVLGEEPGWRGYALPRQLSGQGSLRASLVLGLAWSAWHLPLWLTRGHPMHGTFLLWPVLEAEIGRAHV